MRDKSLRYFRNVSAFSFIPESTPLHNIPIVIDAKSNGPEFISRPRVYRTKTLWKNAVKRLSSERKKRRDFATIAFAMMNSKDSVKQINNDVIKQESTDISLNNHLQELPSNNSSLRNGKIDDTANYSEYDNDEFYQITDSSGPADNGKNKVCIFSY